MIKYPKRTIGESKTILDEYFLGEELETQNRPYATEISAFLSL